MSKLISIEIKPCPFCGFDADLVWANDTGAIKAQCMNEDCNCSLPAWVSHQEGESIFERIQLAVKYWNGRFSIDEKGV